MMFAMTFLGYTMSIFWFFIVAVVWVAIAVWPAMIAMRKGHSFIGWFILSLFFWWITLFVALFMKDKSYHSDMAAGQY
jgi:hypothetical protein